MSGVLTACFNSGNKDVRSGKGHHAESAVGAIATGTVQGSELSQYVRQYSLSLKDVGAAYDQSTNILYVSGFDADDDGRLYLAAGLPVVVTCFNGTEKVWSREISPNPSRFGLFKWFDHHVYFIDEQDKALKQMPDNGTGEVMSHALNVGIIDGGSFRGNGYCLMDSLSYDNDSKRRGTIRKYRFPDNLLSEARYTALDTCWYAWAADNDTILLPDIGRELTEGGPLFVCKGEVRDSKVFTSVREYGDCTIALQPKHGGALTYLSVPSLPAFNVIVSTDGDEIITNPDYDILKNGKLYLVGYDKNPEFVVVTVVDIERFGSTFSIN